MSIRLFNMKSTATPSQTLDQVQRARQVQRVTWVALLTNSLLAIGQLVVGIFANAFSLVADAVHTLSDLITDTMVLIAGRKSEAPADRDHPYGHGRFETAATLFIGAALGAVGIMFLWNAGLMLQNLESAAALHQAALWMAGLTLLAKETLFRYTLAASKHLKAPMLEANAWHARSDAASSLVVAAGIAGSLAGYTFLEPLAAAVVGFMIASMGGRIAWRALRELVDTGLPEGELKKLRNIITSVPGVIDVHDIRTRRMANRILCDAHVRVNPRITVSEGHHISDLVYLGIRANLPDIHEVLVHIDAEDDTDLQTPAPGDPLERDEIERLILAETGLSPDTSRLQIHYLGQRVEIEIMQEPVTGCAPDTEAHNEQAQALTERILNLQKNDPRIRRIRVYRRVAP